MAHFTLEYSSNMDNVTDIAELCDVAVFVFSRRCNFPVSHLLVLRISLH